ncbi:hypothetical protein [Desulfotruncus alcoholivorax]|uniref:hypothetical protein n=1 Tax=Desulfotruncus alcoholivorax TaxID=265477 RepID=UPI0012FEF141|nr:hypothetical protein [Desulfotruncus alcoholivorax]
MPAPPGPKETDFPIPAEMPNYSEEDDAPLSGPWNRNSGAKESGAKKRETIGCDPVLMEPGPQRTGDMQHVPESAAFKHPAMVETVLLQQPESEELVCPKGEISPGRGQGRHKRRRRKNPLAAALNGKPELVGSILVGEIIGTRGGYRGRRK